MKVLTEARREAIVEAASKLFQEFGYEGASMNELAIRLRGSKATLYRYFPSKEALFDAVVRASSTAGLAKAVQHLQSSVAQQVELAPALRQFGETMLSAMDEPAGALAVYRMVVAEAGRSEVGELFYAAGPRECVMALSALLKAAMDRGDLRSADPEIMALHFLGLVTAETGIRLYQRNPPRLSAVQTRAMVERAVDMFMGGAAPR
ncbi:TetR/AcrR family transcriptional regulator TvrR [soil metagenome]